MINPPTAFLPFKVPCGPFKTSTLSKSKNPASDKMEFVTLWPLIAETTESTTDAPTPGGPDPLILMLVPEPSALE